MFKFECDNQKATGKDELKTGTYHGMLKQMARRKKDLGKRVELVVV